MSNEFDDQISNFPKLAATLHSDEHSSVCINRRVTPTKLQLIKEHIDCAPLEYILNESAAALMATEMGPTVATAVLRSASEPSGRSV